ncbi:MAG TPA: SusC/RagA family TonB-linked outer membrane protein [Chitinophagaceae bacterium]|jgi:TonB-linked SusC/RagA family outer membrane protein|nr:SusC/RagA family TonB-linked outer membrane protein [Chitinophagaceae bacterium]
MRKIASLLSVLMLLCTLALGQTRIVTGQVTDENGVPVPFASVTIKSTKQGTNADQNGNFSIKVNSGDILIISSQGRVSKEVTIGSQATVSVSLQTTNSTLSEVIVSTGYNTKRTQRSTVSNAQVVGNQQLTTIRQSNLNNALAGKVAGIQIRSQSVAALGRNADIRLRGDGTLYGQSVLYVVDGTPVNSVDINPDDIEDLTVLSGPTGAAIYGPQAADGAIVINTKRAKRNQKGIGIEVNAGVQFDKIYILPNYQNSYAGGGEGDLIQFTWKPGMPDEWKPLDGKFYHDYTDDASWGPRMAGQEYIPWYSWYPGTKYTGTTAKLVPQKNNARDFYNTGITSNNNINFSKAGDGYNLRLSYTNLDVRGIIPNSWLKRSTLATNGSIDLGSHFTVGANINYVTQSQQAENDDAYSNQSSGSFNQWFHRDLDMDILKEMKDYKTPISSTGGGILASWNHANPNSYSAASPDKFYAGNYWYNFYTYFNNITNNFRRDRLYGDVNFSYKVNNDLKFRFAYRKNLVNTNSEDRIYYDLEKSATQTGIKAAYGTGETFFNDSRYELTGTYNKKITEDFSLDLLAGAESVKILRRDLSANTRSGLYIPDYFSLNNSIDPIAQSNFRSEEKRRAAFTRGSIGFRNYLFGEFTLRNDFFSTLPADDNNIFTKSVGASFVFGDFLKNALPWLSYGKIRGSWGEVPQSIGPYNLELAYGVGADQWNNNFVMGTPNQIVSPTIKGAVQTTKEAGIDLRFLKNRVGISGTYFNSITSNSPIAVQVNGASGFTSKLINAGKITRNGLEFQLNARPIIMKDFNWDINAAFSKIIKNVVNELAEGVDQINVSGGVNFSGITTPLVVHQVGQPWGMLIGGGKTYIDGVPVLDDLGHYVKAENVKFGSVLPEYTGGVQNSFSYKGIVLNVNIDFQKGGKFFSLSDMWGSFSGLTARTAVINDRGIPIRDRVADGGGVHVVGVDASKSVVDMYVEAQDYFHSLVNNNVYDEFIYDLTFVKMREVSLGYRLPIEKWGNLGRSIQNATFSVVARNPWLIYSKTKDFDPSEISSTYGENGQFPGTRSLGVNLKVGF